MQAQTIRADQVKAGDLLFNNLAPNPVYQWVRVTQTNQRLNMVTITTQAFETVKHAAEGVAVMREDQ